MVRTRPTLPAGHGEVVERPAYDSWHRLLEANREAAARWGFAVAGVPADRVRAQARADLISVAGTFSEKLGVALDTPGGGDEPIVLTGHQPDLYHPGVWVKDFLLDRLAHDTGATAIDVMVDSDGFDAVSVTSPCMTPGVARCRQYLAIGGTGASYAFSPVPSASELSDFCSATDQMLASLPAPAIRRHFGDFCEHLSAAASAADNLAELVTIARRRHESAAGTRYLEAPVTALARTRGFALFVADMALNAQRFVDGYNHELGLYRALTKTRSSAQPFPDLRSDGERIELPLWHLTQTNREPVWAQAVSDGSVRLMSGPVTLCELPADPQGAVDAVLLSGALMAPKALALTLFLRMFACDLFIHGIGGGRYDQVTDAVIRRYYGVEPPVFVVASMTMYLPLGAHVVTLEEVAAAKERLNRIEHNPDALMAEVEFDDPAERDLASSLAAEKVTLVAAIASPDADKKALGLRIREVNRALADIMAPVRDALQAELDGLETQLAASEILTDRTYPFCFWDPAEIADKVG